MSCPVVPAIIPKSQTEVVDLIKQLSFAKEIQLDLVDGKFVQSVSWPYEPKGEPMAVKPHTDKFTLEVDLMVAEPLLAARDWVRAGADMLVFHSESVALEPFVNFVDNTDVTVGVSMNGTTPMETFLPYAAAADYVQLMGIYEVGAQGQPFDEAVLNKIQIIKKEFPNKMISIDGAVNKNTIQRLREAGASRFIVGSAIVTQEDPLAAYQELCELIK
jgi:ribulose-phosphate 3-epimerase